MDLKSRDLETSLELVVERIKEDQESVVIPRVSLPTTRIICVNARGQ